MTIKDEIFSWQSLLEKTRAYNLSVKGDYDMCLYWRAQAYQKNPDAPEAMVQACAFAAVMDNIHLHSYEGETLAGSRVGFRCEHLPNEISETDYLSAVDEHDQRGRRDFTAGWDHTLADYPTLLNEGTGGLLERIKTALKNSKVEANTRVLEAMGVTVEAFSRFISRHADQAENKKLAASLRHIAIHPPRTFREAMQLVWLTHIAFVSEGRYANALGRIDQYLYPFYKSEIRSGLLTKERALNLLCALWARIEELGEVTNICVGGLQPDGRCAVNELSYLCIEATRLVQSPHANLSARFHDETPPDFYRACFECIRTGVGFPAIFNDQVLLEGLAEIGIQDEVARDYCMVGCIETMFPGRQQAWSDSRFNTPLFLLQALHKFSNEKTFTWEHLLDLVHSEIASGIALHTEKINKHIARYPPEVFPDPFLSALTHDCIGRGKDINDGGAQFERFHGIAVMGLATIADSLATIRKLVLDENKIELDTLMNALILDFNDQEPLRQMLVNGAPKYGNDDRYVDDIAAWVVKITADECLKYRTEDGGRFVSAMAANTSNIPAGKEVGATPDGRKSGLPLSDAASPFFGRDKKGPTAFLHSVSRPDYKRVLTGSVINMKFEPDFFRDEAGAQRFIALMKFFVRERIPELQFNFTGTETLKAAQDNPEHFENLVVRVSGFSAYFTRLNREVQDDVIRRKAHGA